MKNILKQEKGVSLLSLAAVIVVMGIITTMLLYSVRDTSDVTDLTSLYSDINNLGDKISSYYTEYGNIPALEITNANTVEPLKTWITEIEANSYGTGSPVGVNDSSNFLVIDLHSLDNLTLNYGRDYESVESSKDVNNRVTLENNMDIYVVNKASHNIFYLKGIEVEGKYYYSNQEADAEKLDLRYIEGVKIPTGYSYKSGNKSSGIIIEDNLDNTKTYKWIDMENRNYSLNKVGNDYQLTGESVSPITIILSGTQTPEIFINSVNQHKGFYLKQNDVGNVVYFAVDEEKWSMTYNDEGIYKDENDDTAYIPAGFKVSKLPGQSVISKGLVIKNDTTSAEYVWIDVPDRVLKGITNLSVIESELRNYASDYQDASYTDTWYDGCGVGTGNDDDYEDLKEAMLKSIKNNGGFWISRDKSSTQANCYSAYSNVAATNNGRTTSLMFGLQWDLVCKFLEDETVTSGAEVYNIKNLVGNGQITLESTSTNSQISPTDNKAVVRGTSTIDDRNTIPYTQAGYYRTTIF